MQHHDCKPIKYVHHVFTDKADTNGALIVIIEMQAHSQLPRGIT